jgi:hypothetical protein
VGMGGLVSIRQHTAAYGSIRQHTSAQRERSEMWVWEGSSAYVSIRQHTSAYVSAVREVRDVGMGGLVSIRQHTAAYVSIRQRSERGQRCGYGRAHVGMCECERERQKGGGVKLIYIGKWVWEGSCRHVLLFLNKKKWGNKKEQ